MLILIGTATAYAQYRDVKLPEEKKQVKFRDHSNEKKGFWCAIEADGGSSVMDGKKNMQYVAATFTGGYRFSEYIRIGLGVGAKVYVNNSDVNMYGSRVGVPIFANARGNFISAYDRDGVPFWSVNIGGVTSQGIYFNPTIGYSFGGLRNNFLIGLSYTLQAFQNSSGTNTAYSYLGVKIGYEF